MFKRMIKQVTECDKIFVNHMLSFIKKLLYFIQNSYIVSQSQKYMDYSICLHSCQDLVLLLFFISTIVTMCNDNSCWV